ncbi:TPA: DUF4435 domain-containing protein [Pseudomonas aeruginosa]|nr:DUF4435 domain-containing protein [Pseudomonas aeruginosa]HBP5743706.1 DUF4435 domain-containing protein [Pseudomonas aeruginosa]HCF6212264.1 DUF4435 domain-containing protein [Pseudomonas aeruginosa]HCL3482949.1 DUF4435 domain-containing protein [Pseudomonas aeruginosa]HCT2624275.1 DUF4435 domain-containing protein [Pseudomonas aeruginosa]
MNIERMREQRGIPQVALQAYNLVRSKNPDVVVCVFEGRDDVIFYETLFQRIGTTVKYVSFVANGKDLLLGLRALLSKSEEHPDKVNIYFADKDFDGLKSYPVGEDIYVTDTYSIENSLVCGEVLEKILRSDLKCDHSEDDAIAHIMEEFNSLLREYEEKLRSTNLIIYHCRKRDIVLPSIEDAKNFFSVTNDSVKLKFDNPLAILKWPDSHQAESIAQSEEEFNALCPLKDWRGKFLFYFFQEFIKNQVQRRTSSPAEVFKSRARVTFNPKTELRTFAVFCDMPKGLETFVKRHLGKVEGGFNATLNENLQQSFG